MSWATRMGVGVALAWAAPAGAVTGAAWTGEYDVANLNAGSAVAGAGDVNGDGYADVLVGAYAYDGARGAVVVHLGSVSGPRPAPDQLRAGSQASERFGWAMTGAGDVDGDGFDDVIVGAPDYTDGPHASAGRAVVFHGSSAGLAPAPGWEAHGASTDADFGEAVSSAGDVNGDGFDDVVIGAPYAQQLAGEASVYLGSAAGLGAAPAWSYSNVALTRAGTSVASAGDVNDDGFGDVLVGAPLTDGAHAAEGAALLFLGSATGLGANAAWVAHGTQASEFYGLTVAGVGDLNGDGYDDIAIGTPDHDQSVHVGSNGLVEVFFGGPTGPGAAADWRQVGQPDVRCGTSIASRGDLNGDGFDDLAFGCPLLTRARLDEGVELVYLGSATGLGARAAVKLLGEADYAQLGAASAIAGDVDGDGFDDLLVGAPYIDLGQRQEGAAFLFLGR